MDPFISERREAVRAIVRDASKQNYRMSAFVMGVVNSKAFLTKRAEPMTADANQN